MRTNSQRSGRHRLSDPSIISADQSLTIGPRTREPARNRVEAGKSIHPRRPISTKMARAARLFQPPLAARHCQRSHSSSAKPQRPKQDFSRRSSCTVLRSVGVILRPRITHTASFSGPARLNTALRLRRLQIQRKCKLSECCSQHQDSGELSGAGPTPATTNCLLKFIKSIPSSESTPIINTNAAPMP